MRRWVHLVLLQVLSATCGAAQASPEEAQGVPGVPQEAVDTDTCAGQAGTVGATTYVCLEEDLIDAAYFESGGGISLAGGAVPAPDSPEAAPTVEFSGGSVLNMLVCKSQPSTGRLSVPAESRVSFVNRLGQNATLRMGGRTVTSVGANQAVPVVFHHGPVEVSMTWTFLP